MAFPYKIFPEAQADLDAALDWYGEQGGQELKGRFFAAYLEARHRICDTPEIFPFSFEQFRKARLKAFPFKIIYRVEKDTVYIVAVAHDKRGPDFWKGRV